MGGRGVAATGAKLGHVAGSCGTVIKLRLHNIIS
jgi:hypothetical protein